MKTVKFGKKEVGPGQPPYIIAEIGANHNGDMDLCRRLIDAAADAGADAAKFQSWSEKSLIAKEEYDRNTSYSDKKKHFGSLRDMVRAYQLTPAQHHEASDHCRKKGIAFASSPFANDEADLLDKLNVPFIKIASMDVINLPLLRHVATKKRPVILSTGMATLGEIEQAIATITHEGNDQIVLLHCVAIYPPEYEMINLRNIETLQRTFGFPVGFSDHTLGTSIPLAAIALGACVIEKHFTLDQDMEGWDHAISATPADLKVIVDEGRHVFTSVGTTERVISLAEMEKRKKFRRSIVTTRRLSKGHVLTEADLCAKRPGTGIPPDEMRFVVGRTIRQDLEEDRVIRWDDLN